MMFVEALVWTEDMFMVWVFESYPSQHSLADLIPQQHIPARFCLQNSKNVQDWLSS